MGSDSNGRSDRPRKRKLAGAPISWGVCEVPGWGRMLSPERVLGEMASLGLDATELGPLDYLPLEAVQLRTLLDGHGLGLVAAFVPLVLHEESFTAGREAADRIAAVLAGAGAEVFMAALVKDDAWSAPTALDEREREHVVEHLAAVDELVRGHGLKLALHPHAGTLVEKASEIEWLVSASDVGFCFDTGHFVIGGMDPVRFVREHADRIVHVHLKDVDAALAAQVRDGAVSLVEATRAGLFRPLGRGDVEIGEVVGLLDRFGYDGWLVLEQDTAITGEEPPVGSGPILDVGESIDYLEHLAPQTRRGEVPQS